jgi:putative transposase
VIAVTAGQAGDSTMLKPLLAHLVVRRLGPGRPRTRPQALLSDKAYSSRGNRALLRAKRAKTVIPQPSDQIGHRLRRGSAGGRPPAFDEIAYKGRNVVERSFNDHKQWRGLATRYDKLAVTYRGRRRAPVGDDLAAPIRKPALVVPAVQTVASEDACRGRRSSCVPSTRMAQESANDDSARYRRRERRWNVHLLQSRRRRVQLRSD